VLLLVRGSTAALQEVISCVRNLVQLLRSPVNYLRNKTFFLYSNAVLWLRFIYSEWVTVFISIFSQIKL